MGQYNTNSIQLEIVEDSKIKMQFLDPVYSDSWNKQPVGEPVFLTIKEAEMTAVSLMALSDNIKNMQKLKRSI